MPVSAAMKTHLAQNVTTLCEVVKLTARDGTIVGMASHTRDLTFEAVLYRASVIEPTRPVGSVGIEADKSEIKGAFNDYLTKADVLSEKWKGAVIQKEIVNYLDLTMESFRKQVGFVGKIEPIGEGFVIEFRSQVDRLKQKVGDITSNSDRNTTIEETGLDEADFDYARTITDVTDRRIFKVAVIANPDNLTNGRIIFTSGGNNGRSMEIKTATTTDAGTKTQIELQIPMPSTVAVGNTLTVIEGYDGTRERAKELGEEAVLNMACEPDMPAETKLISYPQD